MNAPNADFAQMAALKLTRTSAPGPAAAGAPARRRVAAPRIRVAAVLACYNRRAQTLTCLESLAAQVLPPGVQVDVWLLDDASPDGTGAAVRAAFPGVRVLDGSGGLYWNGGMRVAFAAALAGDYDFYWWLNDDVRLARDALARLLDVARPGVHSAAHIVVGSLHQGGDAHAYGGLRRTSRWRPTRLLPVAPGTVPVPCETMNGNCVLIPRAVAAVVGNLDGAYVHSMGDTDYGLRARRAGFGVYVAPGYFGQCARNSPLGSCEDPTLHWRARFAHLRSVKALPWRPWLHYTRRHAGVLWPLCFAWPYLRLAVQALRPAGRRGGPRGGKPGAAGASSIASRPIPSQAEI